MDRNLKARQALAAAAFALAATGAFALGTNRGTDSSTNDNPTPSQERANPTANGNASAANSQASSPRTQKDEAKGWNAAPPRAKHDGKRYDSVDPAKNSADEPSSQPSSHGGGNQAPSGQG